MVKYLGVTAVRRHGVRIERSFDPTLGHVPSEKRLILIRSNGAWEIAPDVTHPGDYAAVYGAYQGGEFRDYEFYLLDERAVAHCPDEGRHYIT